MKINLSIAFGYFVLGLIGLNLAIPPGYASPIFPAAGFAVGIALVFGFRKSYIGIALGSLTLNIVVGLQHGSLSVTGVLVALGIGIGSTLQAGVAAYFVKKYCSRDWWHLDHEKPILGFYLLAGFVPCLTSATLSNFTLYWAEVVNSSGLINSWVSWYLGDLLGVLLVTPMVVAIANRKDEVWQSRSKIICISLAANLVFVFLVAFSAGHYLNTHLGQQIDAYGEKIKGIIENRIAKHTEVVASLARLLEQYSDIDNDRFEKLTRSILSNHKDIFALSYNKYILQHDRTIFEEKVRERTANPRFEITQRDIQGALVPSQERENYVVVSMISPIQGNEAALGFDIGSEPIRRQAIEASFLKETQVATAPLQLVQDEQPKVGMLILSPVFLDRQNAGKRLIGFSVAVVKVEEMVNIAISSQLSPELKVHLMDSDESVPKRQLFNSPITGEVSSELPKWESKIEIANRTWLIDVSYSSEYLANHPPYAVWLITLFGLLVSTLLQLWLFSMSGRTVAVERKVKEQTSEIRNKSEALELALDKAEQASVAKSQFLSVMSHELRTPLNSIEAMFQFIARTSSTEEIQEYVKEGIKSSEHLLHLIEHVLDFSKLESGRLALETLPFILSDAISDVRASCHNYDATQIELVFEVEPRLDEGLLVGDALRLSQVLINLVGNSLKFTKQGTVKLSAELLGMENGKADIRFSVSDTGVGMTDDQLAQLFQPFVQADMSIHRQFGGTGLGLSISKKLVYLMGGVIKVSSCLNQGSCFSFELQIPFEHSSQTI